MYKVVYHGISFKKKTLSHKENKKIRLNSQIHKIQDLSSYNRSFVRFKNSNTACYSSLYGSQIKKDEGLIIKLFLSSSLCNEEGKLKKESAKSLIRILQDLKFKIKITEEYKNKLVIEIIANNMGETKFLTSLMRLSHEGGYINWYTEFEKLKKKAIRYKLEIDEMAMIAITRRFISVGDGHSAFVKSRYILPSQYLKRMLSKPIVMSNNVFLSLPQNNDKARIPEKYFIKINKKPDTPYWDYKEYLKNKKKWKKK